LADVPEVCAPTGICKLTRAVVAFDFGNAPGGAVPEPPPHPFNGKTTATASAAIRRERVMASYVALTPAAARDPEALRNLAPFPPVRVMHDWRAHRRQCRQPLPPLHL
jgi:hypothetical protein